MPGRIRAARRKLQASSTTRHRETTAAERSDGLPDRTLRAQKLRATPFAARKACAMMPFNPPKQAVFRRGTIIARDEFAFVRPRPTRGEQEPITNQS
jgi:hypothetical protein